MGLSIQDNFLPSGATPLSEEDKKGLLVDTVFDRETLNLVEAENITKAKIYFMTHKKKYSSLNYLLSDTCVKDVHEKMFEEVWSWAGVYRSHDTTIGIPFEQIAVKTRELMLSFQERAKYIGNLDDNIDLFALQLHFELVSIHPFPNGNGRQTRQMTDLLLRALGRPSFSWSEHALIRDTKMRQDYISAIEHACAYETRGDLAPLLHFARQ